VKGKPTQTGITIFVDADNTLWDTDRVFADAQLGLLEQIETAAEKKASGDDRLAFVRAVDQALAERHHDGLRYPPRLLARALAEALGGLAPQRAARRALLDGPALALPPEVALDAEQSFFACLASGPEVRTGVIETLPGLHDAGHRLFVITEGSRVKAQQTLERLALNSFFDRLIEGKKRPELYRRILKLAGSPDDAFMVGDQLDRDIAPAKAAGLQTIYFPGGFAPKWAPDEESVRPDFRITSFAELPGIIERVSATISA
jgi:putative hydrolase of the HAD superfamily